MKTGVDDLFRRGNKLFKFEVMWLSKKECGKIMEEAWNGSAGEDITHRLNKVSRILSGWAMRTFANLKKKEKGGFNSS